MSSRATGPSDKRPSAIVTAVEHSKTRQSLPNIGDVFNPYGTFNGIWVTEGANSPEIGHEMIPNLAGVIATAVDPPPEKEQAEELKDRLLLLDDGGELEDDFEDHYERWVDFDAEMHFGSSVRHCLAEEREAGE